MFTVDRLYKLIFFTSSLLFCWIIWKYFNETFPSVNIPIVEDHTLINSRSLELFKKYSSCPFVNDSDVKVSQTSIFRVETEARNYIELSSRVNNTGRKLFNRMISENRYNFYRWKTRFYVEGEECETWISFSSDLEPIGFYSHLPETLIFGPNVNNTEAEEIVNTHMLFHNLTKYEKSGYSQTTQLAGRVDHQLVYEMKDFPLPNDGKIELVITVGGNKLIGIHKRVKIPENFTTQYEIMRNWNETLAKLANYVFLFFGAIFLIIGSFVLYRGNRLNYRNNIVLAITLSILVNVVLEISKYPVTMIGYKTHISKTVYLLENLAGMLTQTLAAIGMFMMVFIIGEGLTRYSLFNKLQFFKILDELDTWEVINAFLMGNWTILMLLAYIVLFYKFMQDKFNWYLPQDSHIDPNSLSHYFPWLTCVITSSYAGIFEEFAFRGLILGGFYSLAVFMENRWNCSFILRWNLHYIGSMIQVVCFAAAHAFYATQPFYARLIELLFPSIVFGALYKKYGLFVPIYVHYGFDLFWFSSAIWFTTSKWVWVYRIILILCFFIPYPFIFWSWVSNKRKIRDNIKNESQNVNWKKEERMVEDQKPKIMIKRFGLTRNSWKTILCLMIYLCVALFLLFLFVIVKKSKFTNSYQLDSVEKVEKISQDAFQKEEMYDKDFRDGSVMNCIYSSGYISTYSEHLYVLLEMGDKYEEFLSEGFLQKVHSWCRFTKVKHIEEYHYIIYDNKIKQVLHRIPEDRVGKILTETEAREIAKMEIEKSGVKFERLGEISAKSEKQTKRTDWTFKYNVTSAEYLRIEIVIQGDEIAIMEKKVHVPDEWARNYSKKRRLGGIISQVLMLIPAGFMAILGIWSLKNLINGLYSSTIFHSTWIMVLIISTTNLFLKLKRFKFNFSPTEPQFNQYLTTFGIAALGVLAQTFFTSTIYTNLTFWSKKVTCYKNVLASASLGLLRVLVSLIFRGMFIVQLLVTLDKKYALGWNLDYTDKPRITGEWLFELSCYSPLLMIFLNLFVGYFNSSAISFFKIWFKDWNVLVGCIIGALFSSVSFMSEVESDRYIVLFLSAVSIQFLLYELPIYYFIEKKDVDHIRFSIYIEILIQRCLDYFKYGTFPFGNLSFAILILFLILGFTFIEIILRYDSDLATKGDEEKDAQKKKND